MKQCYWNLAEMLHPKKIYQMVPGAIIGDEDRKREQFIVLGLAPWYGTVFLFLEQIAPSPAAHAHTCCEDFCGCRAGEMASEIHEIFYAFSPRLKTFMSVGIWLKYFRRNLLQFEWSKAVSNLGMSSFISQVVLRYFFLYKHFTFLHSNFHKCRRLTAFPWHSKKLDILEYIPRQHFKAFLLFFFLI